MMSNFKTFTPRKDKKIKRCSIVKNGVTIKVFDSLILDNGDTIRYGDYLTYYESGESRVIGSYRGGEKDGQWIKYRKNGSKEWVVDYFFGRKNNMYIFDKNDSLIKEKSSYVKVDHKDTIHLDSTLKVDIKLVNPPLGMRFSGKVGNQFAFSSSFRVKDSSLVQELSVKEDSSFSYSIKEHRLGENRVRGYLNNIKKPKEKSDSIKMKRYFFDRPYYVIDY